MGEEGSEESSEKPDISKVDFLTRVGLGEGAGDRDLRTPGRGWRWEPLQQWMPSKKKDAVDGKALRNMCPERNRWGEQCMSRPGKLYGWYCRGHFMRKWPEYRAQAYDQGKRQAPGKGMTGAETTGKANNITVSESGNSASWRTKNKRLIQLLTGEISVEDLTDEEIISGQIGNPDGQQRRGKGGAKNALVPLEVHEKLRKELFRRAETDLEDGMLSAIAKLRAIIESPMTADQDALRAVDLLLNRAMGKATDKVEINVTERRFEKVLVQIDREALLDDVQDIEEADIVEPNELES